MPLHYQSHTDTTRKHGPHVLPDAWSTNTARTAMFEYLMVIESLLWMFVVVFVRREAGDGGAVSDYLEMEVPIVEFLLEMTIVIVDECG